MVWLNRSPIPVGRREVISSFKWFLPAFPRVQEWGVGIGTLRSPCMLRKSILALFEYTNSNSSYWKKYSMKLKRSSTPEQEMVSTWSAGVSWLAGSAFSWMRTRRLAYWLWTSRWHFPFLCRERACWDNITRAWAIFWEKSSPVPNFPFPHPQHLAEGLFDQMVRTGLFFFDGLVPGIA